jgi:molecular chaperone GrpE
MLNKETEPNVELENLVDEVIEKLRPVLVNIVREVIAKESNPEQETNTPDTGNDDVVKTENTIPLFIDNVQRQLNTIEQTGKEQHEAEKLQLDAIEILLKESARKEKIIDDLHNELQKYKSGLRRDIISPLLKSLIHYHGKVTDQYRFYKAKQADETVDRAAVFPTLLNEYKNLALGLEDLLYDYDVETVEPKAGEEFNPRTQKAVQSVPADNPDNDRKIVACVNVGFKDAGNERVIKQPEVTVYKLINN